MNRATAYGLLCAELESWRNVAYQQLVTQIGHVLSEKIVGATGEIITVRVSVNWLSNKQNAVRVKATAEGSSCFRLERLEQSIIVRPTEPA